MNTILDVKNLSISFGGLKAVDQLSFTVSENNIYGLIGPNGAGKTTVFNCISRFYTPDEGTISYSHKAKNKVHKYNLLDYKVHEIIGLGIVRTFQNVELVKMMTVMDNLMIGNHVKIKGNVLRQGLYLPSIKREEKRIREDAGEIITFLGLNGYENQLAGSQPYGIQKLIELGRTLMSKPNLIILDEPAAGMNQMETKKLSSLIRKIRDVYNVTILIVEHDMNLVMDVCDRICVIDFGKKLAEGTPKEIQNDIYVQEAYLGKEKDSECLD